MQLGRAAEAKVAFDQAIALAHTPAEAAHIRLHLDRLMAEAGRLEDEKINRDHVGLVSGRSS